MDPDANLAEQLELANRILACGAGEMEDGELERLAELVEALDEWIKSGGFLPEAWQVTKVEGREPKG